MEITQVKELMLRAFKKGQEKPDTDDYPIKLWIAGEIEDHVSRSIKDANNHQVNREGDAPVDCPDVYCGDNGYLCHKCDSHFLKKGSLE